MAPENTLPAFAEAVALGADEIEFDLWPTADGQLVVCHDPAVDRTTDGTGTICDMTCEEIRGFDAGVKFCEEYAGVRLPLFEEVLQQFAGRVVMNIHIKSLGRPVIENAVMMERGRELSKVYLKNRPLPMPLSDPVEEVLTELEETPCEPYDEKNIETDCQFVKSVSLHRHGIFNRRKGRIADVPQSGPDIKDAAWRDI